jgi:hypothetical protein
MTLDQLRKCVELTDKLLDVLSEARVSRFTYPGDDQLRYCRDDVESLHSRFEAKLSFTEASRISELKHHK